jgi:hypothetical protein
VAKCGGVNGGLNRAWHVAIIACQIQGVKKDKGYWG